MAEKLCPLLKEPCLEHRCRFYIHILGANPQTGVQEDKWDCTFAWLPILLIENSQMQRQTGAAVESFRNETVRGSQQVAAALSAAASMELLPHDARARSMKDITPRDGT